MPPCSNALLVRYPSHWSEVIVDDACEAEYLSAKRHSRRFVKTRIPQVTPGDTTIALLNAYVAVFLSRLGAGERYLGCLASGILVKMVVDELIARVRACFTKRERKTTAYTVKQSPQCTTVSSWTYSAGRVCHAWIFLTGIKVSLTSEGRVTRYPRVIPSFLRHALMRTFCDPMPMALARVSAMSLNTQRPLFTSVLVYVSTMGWSASAHG